MNAYKHHSGKVYSHYGTQPLFDYPCDLGGDRCCHFSCHMEELRRIGLAHVAEQLERNNKARDWLYNWGKILYDPQDHGKDPKRRKLAADIVRSMRNGKVDSTSAVIGGCWIGALTN